MLSLILLTIAGVFSSFSQIANKKLAKPAYSSESLTTAQMLLNALIALPLLFYRFDVPSDFKYWALTLLSTLSFAFSTKYFFKALQLADVSLVSILYKLNIVFVVIIGIALLKESYTIIQSIGLILIIFSSIFVIYKGSIIKSVNLSIIYVLAACMFTTFSSIADKIVLNHFSPFTYVFVNNLLIGLIFAFNKKNILGVKTIIKHNFRLLFVSSFFMTAAFVLLLVTLKLHDVSKTLPVFSSLGLITTVLLGVVFLGERQNLTKKLIATISIIFGSYLLFV